MPIAFQLLSLGYHGYGRFSQRVQDAIKNIPAVKSASSYQITLHEWTSAADHELVRKRLLELGIKPGFLRLSQLAGAAEARFEDHINSPEGFSRINFGPDIAEDDPNLSEYFIHTEAYRRALGGDRTLVIGPKGSGKSAILRTLVNNVDSNYTVVITPEKYAKALLRDILQQEAAVGSEIHAFSAAWTFTILTEVFRQVITQKKGLRTAALARIHSYMRDHVADVELDLLSRFVQFWKRIQAIKLGPFEISVKTRELENLYKLSDLLALLPALKTAVNDRTFFVLIDELDQGWDNTPVSNTFLISLLLTAIRLHSYKAGIQIIAFLRTEIFDILKAHFDQLDKMRGNMEMLRWNRRALAGVVASRAAYSIGYPKDRLNPEAAVATLFPESVAGSELDGFGYLLTRTSLRPREVIQFARLAHQEAENQGLRRITSRALGIAEEEFSAWRLDHLCSEYLHIYPDLRALLERFRHNRMILSAAEGLDVIITHILESEQASSLPVWLQGLNEHDVARILFDVSFWGFKDITGSTNEVGSGPNQFVFSYARPGAKLRRDVDLMIHPGYVKALEIIS
jgi:hypothetical protein